MPVLTRPDGVRLYHELHGNEQAPPVILLEGMGGDIPGWRRNIPVLARELRVIAYDFRGNGNSDEPSGPVTMTTFVDDTLALLDSLGVDRAHVYGQSFGGMVAQELALSNPERVRTLDPRLHPRGSATRGAREALRRAQGPAVAVDVRPRVPRPAPGARRGGPPDRGRAAGTSRGWTETMGGDAGLRQLRSPPEPAGPDARPARHGGPGDRRRERRAPRGAIPGAELVLLDGAGHLYHSEQAAAADAAVLDFIRRHPDG